MRQSYLKKLVNQRRVTQVYRSFLKISAILDRKELAPSKLYFAKGADFFSFLASFYLSYLLYFDFSTLFVTTAVFQKIVFWSLFCFFARQQLKIESMIWRYINFKDIFRLGIFSGLIFTALVLSKVAFPEISFLNNPLSVCFNSTFYSFSCLVGLRTFRRYLSELPMKNSLINYKINSSFKRTIIVGAGRLGFKVLNEIQGLGDSSAFKVMGFIDDDPGKLHRKLCGVSVLNTVKKLEYEIQKNSIEQVIVAISVPDGFLNKKIYKICENTGVKVQLTPSYRDLLSGKLILNQIRDVQIEDLLGRKPVKLNDINIFSYIKDKTICVSGAGGSIGSELVRQICRYLPKQILLLERSEPALYQIHKEISHSEKFVTKALAADICDRKHLEEIFKLHRPDVVFHAAAHKHVPLMEENIYAAQKNNVKGTHTIADVSGLMGVEQFVLISTDKAVRPTSVMGKSKQLAERVVASLNKKYLTKYCAVRFGNVLGSSGSVIPLFKEQIASGGPITITDERMTRYFMTIPEACQLVLQAGSMSDGGDLFVLDMGEPVRIVDLAKDMIRLSGLQVNRDVKIKYTGVRPGEKLYEELHHDYDMLQKTKHPLIYYTELTHQDLELDSMALNLKFSVSQKDVFQADAH